MIPALMLLAAVSYVVAAVLAAVAAIFYVTQHVRAAHDELSGRSAQREIAEIRAGRRGRSWFGAIGSAAAPAAAAADGDGGSLRVRVFEPAPCIAGPGANAVRAAGAMADEAPTSILGDAAAGTPLDDESPTTLLGASIVGLPRNEGAEPLSSGAVGSSFADDEASTTFLSGPPSGEVR